MKSYIRIILLSVLYFCSVSINARLINVQISLDTDEDIEQDQVPGITAGALSSLCQQSSPLIMTSHIFYNILKARFLGKQKYKQFILQDSDWFIYRTKDAKDFYLFIPKEYKKKINQYNTKQFKRKAKQYKMHKAEEILIGFKIDPSSNILERVTLGDFTTEDEIDEIHHNYHYADLDVSSLSNIFTKGLETIFALFNIILDGHGIYPSGLSPNITINNLFDAFQGGNSMIAGLVINQFRMLIQFFIHSLKVNLLYYSSCYAGDLNLILPYIRALELYSGKIIGGIKKPNFTIIVGSLTSEMVYTLLTLSNCANPDENAINYKQFFNEIEKYTDKERTRPTLYSKKELQEILKPITPRYKEPDDPHGISALPLVMYPNTDQFVAVPLNDKIAVISNVLVKQRELETDADKRSIILQDKEAILIFPKKINVDVKINMTSTQKKPPTLVSMVPGESLIEFDTIETNINIFDFIMNSIGPIKPVSQKYFYIKKLKLKTSGTQLNNVLISLNLFDDVSNINVIFTDSENFIRTYKVFKGFEQKKLTKFSNIIAGDNFLNSIFNYFFLLNSEEIRISFNYESLKNLIPKKELEQEIKKILFDQLASLSIENFSSILNSKIDVNMQDDNGNTLLMIAAYLGLQDKVKLLLKNKANIELTNKLGQDALYWAKLGGNKEIAELIEKKLKLPKVPPKPVRKISVA